MPTVKAADKHLVRSKWPDATCFNIGGSNKVCTDQLGGLAIGFGANAAAAWADAAATVTRKPPPPLPPMGSPTMSLRSDEVFWKGKRHAKAVS